MRATTSSFSLKHAPTITAHVIICLVYKRVFFCMSRKADAPPTFKSAWPRWNISRRHRGMPCRSDMSHITCTTYQLRGPRPVLGGRVCLQRMLRIKRVKTLAAHHLLLHRLRYGQGSVLGYASCKTYIHFLFLNPFLC